MSQQQHCSKSEQRVIKDVVLFTGQTATNGTKYHSINYHCEKEKKNQSPENLSNATWAEACPSQKTTSTASKPKHETPRPHGAEVCISHPVTEVWGVVLASWSGMCASEELVRKWETLCFLPLPFSKGS